ncbi:hypothetical protein LCGC14_0514300 [marine sediment metagenome]|uniref:Uncharacterized protein n=1 Tax=marine sediment metagenome TaxID=412755 RepID=A0A0F9ULP2_9ZZZZ
MMQFTFKMVWLLTWWVYYTCLGVVYLYERFGYAALMCERKNLIS